MGERKKKMSPKNKPRTCLTLKKLKAPLWKLLLKKFTVEVVKIWGCFVFTLYINLILATQLSQVVYDSCNFLLKPLFCNINPEEEIKKRFGKKKKKKKKKIILENNEE